MLLRLHRGIAIDTSRANGVVAAIKQKGLSGDEGAWKSSIPNILDVRKKLDQILAVEKPSKGDIFVETPFTGICACGDADGARYYALKHNRNKTDTSSILITFEADLDDVYIDCRDFLCSAFQFWDRETTTLKERQLSILQTLYGDGISRYFERCISSPDQQVRMAMCNLASFDPSVITAHYPNRKIIGGRYGTRFCSAFFVKAPIASSAIASCEEIEGLFQEPELYVDVYKFSTKG